MKKKTKIWLLFAGVLVLALIAGAVILFGFYLPDRQKQAEWDAAVREYYQTKLSLYREENEAYADYEVDVAFLGDSLTDGYDVKTYYPNFVTANRGIGGETTFGLEERMQVSVYDLKPKVAVLLIGANNLDTMLDNYEQLLLGLRENLPNTKVVLVSLTAMGGDWSHKNQKAAYHNVIIQKLADKYGFSFVDIFTPLFNEETQAIYAHYTSDGVHLNAAGYEVFTNALTPTLKTLLNKK